MDIKMIQEAITELENGNTTMDAIVDLANLYIVVDHLTTIKSNNVEKEIGDIMPAYNNYVDVKRRYQRKEISEGAVVKALNSLCVEIEELIGIIYSNTDMNRERKCINDLAEKIFKKFAKKGLTV